MFKILDTDRDGKLSKKELMAAEKVLHKYDLNDDEVISVAELLQIPTAFTPVGAGVMQAPFTRPTPLVNSPFVLVPREEAPKRITERLAVAKQLIAQYDKDMNGKLSPAEVGVPKEMFDRYDADKDGEWSDLEVVRWMVYAPDLEATVRLGRVGERDGVLDLASAGAAGRLVEPGGSQGGRQRPVAGHERRPPQPDPRPPSLRRRRPYRKRLPGLRPAVSDDR